MIDKEVFKKTEGRLYRYYKQLKFIQKLKRKIDLLYDQKEQVEKEKVELRNLRVEIGNNMGIDYSRDKVQASSSGSSEVERGVIKYIDDLDKEEERILRKILKTNAKIRTIEMELWDIEYNLNMLNEELRRFVEWKYGEKKSIEWISIEMYGGARMTAYRKREEVIENIAQFTNIIK